MLPLVGRDRYVAVKRNSVHRGAAQAALHSLFPHRSKPMSVTLKPQGLTGPGTEGDALLTGPSVALGPAGFDRFRLRRIQFMKIVGRGLFHLHKISILGQQPLSLQTSNDSFGDHFAQSLHLRVFGRGQGHELHRTVLVGLVVKSIRHQQMPMEVEIQKPTEALQKSHRA